MTSQISWGGRDIRCSLFSFASTIRGRANHVASTCDGLVLRMHYKWTTLLLLGICIIIWLTLYAQDGITCVSHFNADNIVPPEHLNVCLSHAYIEENGSRRYLPFYQWIPLSLLILAIIYYIPRKVSKSIDSAGCKKLLEDVAANAHRYDQAETESVEKAARYIIFNLNTHDGLYWMYLFVNLLALVIDIFAMQYLDSILQGRFIHYGTKASPFERDQQNFTDHMSQTFPSFVNCELNNKNQLVNKRTEKYGCHLTIMELYDKVFLAVWIWLIVLCFVTSCYIVFLAIMWLPHVKIFLLRAAKPAHADKKVQEITGNVVNKCKIGDIYLLYRLKSHLSPIRFYELLTRLANPDLYNEQIQHAMTSNNQDGLRSPKPNFPQEPRVNNYHYQLMHNNPEMIAGHLEQQNGSTNIHIDQL